MSQPQYSEVIISPQIEPPQEHSLNQTKYKGGKMGMRSDGGEIVQVGGGRIVRSTSRKDRHSKVYTAKGPRDRRVRLSAHTAIEFYDVQDRLGYDRPSKAVDWLIMKAMPSIDKLAVLPPLHPTIVEDQNAGSNDMIIAKQSESDKNSASAFIPPHMNTDPIALFPTTSATSSVNFQCYQPDLISRANNSTQDLGLSLLSFQNQTGLIHGQSQQPAGANQTHQTLFVGSAPVGFENHNQRIVNWNNEAFMFNNSNQFLGQGSGSAYSQSGTLQSSFSPSVRSWNDIPTHHRSQPVHHASIFGSRFLSDGFAGFCVPEENDGDDSNKPSSPPLSSHY